MVKPTISSLDQTVQRCGSSSANKLALTVWAVITKSQSFELRNGTTPRELLYQVLNP